MGNNLSYKQRELLLAQQLKKQAQYCKLILENNRKLNKFRHDIRNQYLCLKTMLEKEDIGGAREHLNSMFKAISEDSLIVDTNNVIFDALFSEKIQMAMKHDIHMDWEVFIGRELKISEIAWCILIGNTMDYAIDACRQVMDDRKEITVRIKCVGNTLSCYIRNCVNQCQGKQEEDLLKLDRLEKLVEQYEGVIEAEEGEGFFEVKVLLCGV